MKLTIKRSEWLRGEDSSYLFRESDGKKCCLGFLAIACGYSADNIINDETPVCPILRGQKNRWVGGIIQASDGPVYQKNTPAARKLMEINDDAEINDRSREAELTEEFAAIGIKVTFVRLKGLDPWN